MNAARETKAGSYPGAGHRATELGVLVLLSILLFSMIGCATKGKLQLVQFKEVRTGLGYQETVTQDGKVEQRRLPWDASHEFKNGLFFTYTSAAKIEPLIGASCYQGDNGLEGSPWAGLRLIHVWWLGADVGFDKANLTAGFDWLYHATAVGPNWCFPYTLGKVRYGLKAAYLF